MGSCGASRTPTIARASLAVLTDVGLARFGAPRSVHHATVRELYLGRLSEREQQQLARLFEKALRASSARTEPPPRPR